MTLLNIELSPKEKLYHFLGFSTFIMVWWFMYYGNRLHTQNEYVQLTLYSLSYIVFLSINLYLLIPFLLLRQRYVSYVIVIGCVQCLSYFCQQLVYSISVGDFFHRLIINPYLYFRDFGVNILVNAMIGSVGLAFILIHTLLKKQQKLLEYENSMLYSELQQLKGQISPHFLFNTLNNIYVLCKTDSTKAAESILTLADITRYQLYEIQKETVQLSQEISYINELLSLEKLRKDNLVVEQKIIIENDCLVQPLLFTPLVENAIKHGSQKVADCYIFIFLHATSEKLIFTIHNTIPMYHADISEGTGLYNLRRRLNIMYPNSHVLSQQIDNTSYSATLTLQLI
ncbi:MAG TPA: histidine kinase [Candidatus Kapabacteria bacterium]|jgi:two-component system LytT family sensor kinase|nr:histidine kinase [Candidatus Kapabacteria bacterium]